MSRLGEDAMRPYLPHGYRLLFARSSKLWLDRVYKVVYYCLPCQPLDVASYNISKYRYIHLLVDALKRRILVVHHLLYKIYLYGEFYDKVSFDRRLLACNYNSTILQQQVLKATQYHLESV